jgi:signal transduction histidine kinase/ligand-binding sensor domain-containing protein
MLVAARLPALRQALIPALLLSGVVPAWALDPARQVTQYVHDVWQKADGLPQNSVKEIVQTRDGYLWLATQDGVARFDGVRFTVFNTRTTPAFLDDNVWALREDRDGRLWIGTRGGLMARTGNGFASYTTKDGLPANHVRGIYQDRKGTLWIANAGELAIFENGRGRVYKDRAGVGVTGGSSFCETADGSLWIAAGRLYRLKDDLFTVYDEARGVPGRVFVVAPGPDGALWYGTLGLGAGRIEGDRVVRVTVKEGLPSDMVMALGADRDGTMWIGTSGGGLVRYRDGTFAALRADNGLLADEVNSLREDVEGSLWVGTNGGGLHRLKDGDFLTFGIAEGLTTRVVSTVLESTDGSVWAGTVGGGAYRLRNGAFTRFTTKDGLPHDSVISIAEDGAGTIWLGTAGGGLSRMEKNGRFASFPKGNAEGGVIVSALEAGRDGSLWIGSDRGLRRLRDGVLTPVPDVVGGRAYVTALHEDARGTLWIGTFGGGLKSLRDGTVTAYTTKEGLSDDRVASLWEDAAGTLWIGTQGGGLDRFKEGAFTAWRARDGLCSDTVFRVLEDDLGNLWMSSNDGVFRVSKKDLESHSPGSGPPIECVPYGRSSGIRGSECNGGSQPAGWKGRDGRLWFPTGDGIVAVDPKHLRRNDRPPAVVVETLVADGRSLAGPAGREAVGGDAAGGDVAGGGPVTVPAGTERFEFEYAALSFLDPAKMRFRYRLDGLDRDWVDAGTERVAHYTRLPPGQHRFRVVACNNDGVWNEAGASLDLYIKPFFYQTWWFYGLCAASVVLLGGGAFRLRVRRLETRQRELSTLVAVRTEALTIAQDQLKGWNRTLEGRVQEATLAVKESERMAAYGHMVAGVAHEVRHPIFALQAAAYVLTDGLAERTDLRSQLNILERETKRMTTLMDDLLQFARPAELVFAPADVKALLHEAVETYRDEHPGDATAMEVHAADGLPSVVLDRSRLVQVLLNLMDNARKHAAGLTRITLTASAAGSGGGMGPGSGAGKAGETTVRLAVANDGAGVAADHLSRIFEPFYTTGRGSGLGLAIVRRIVRDHGGTIDVESKPEGGTVFTIILPARGPA